MTALRRSTDPRILSFPRRSGEPAKTDQDDEGAHRTPNPVRAFAPSVHQPPPEQRTLFDADPELLAYAQQTQADYAERVVPAHLRERYRSSATLRQFYAEWMEQPRREQMKLGKLAKGTVDKDRQALHRWERITRPAEWPAGKVWPGLPIGYISGAYLTDFLFPRLTAELAPATARSTWQHIRTMLNYAVRVKALDSAPKPTQTIDVPDDLTVIYEGEQITAAYRALATHPSLQVALVLACNAGPRAVDLFTLRHRDLKLDQERPLLTFTSRKTGKLQGIPLAEITVRQLRRIIDGPLTTPDSPVFRGLSSLEAQDPERTHAARRRNKLTKRLLAAAGFDVEDDYAKPWQVARATCNERLESHREGTGQFVLGHSLTLNSKNYRQPGQLICETVNALPQPPCFFEF